MERAKNTPFFEQLFRIVTELGVAFNAHLHLDRYATLDEKYMAHADHRILESSHISLHKKHSLINAIHTGPAYEPEDLRARVNEVLDVMVACGTRRADTMVDVTADNIQLTALELLHEIKLERAGQIDLQLATYSPFGFRDDEPERWDIFRKGVALADFIGALPEADDTNEYPGHIGFTEHCRRVLELGKETGKSIHVHTDQRNEPSEDGTERLIAAVKEFGAPTCESGEPMVWAVHMISPSTYDEARFQRLVDGLLETNTGVICCPSAAVGMRQFRPIMTPTYNSIPRVLELLAAGVFVRLASDNIADICSPSTTADLSDEVFMLSAALRFYNIDVLARLVAGQRLNEREMNLVKQHLQENDREIANALSANTGNP